MVAVLNEGLPATSIDRRGTVVIGRTMSERREETVIDPATGEVFVPRSLGKHLRDLMVLQVAPDRPDLVDATQDRRERLTAQRDVLPRESMLRAVAILADTLAEMRQGPARLPLELALAKLAVPSLAGDVEGLADRVSRLEAGAPAARPAAPAAPAAPRPASPCSSSPSPSWPAGAATGTQARLSRRRPAPQSG